MRRVWVVVAACALALGTLTACTTSLPAGVDGQLTDDWPAMAAAVTQTPVAGVCYSEQLQESWTGGYVGVACTTSHWTETAYVGTFTGATAARSVPPLAGSADLVTTYADCQAKSKDYLGGDWHTGYVWLSLTLPNSKAWKGGARWYRCELSTYSHDLDTQSIQSKISLKGDLSGARTQAKTCRIVAVTSAGVFTKEDGVDCSAPHNGEFVGTWTAPAGPYPTSQSARFKMIGNGCVSLETSFLGINPDHSRYFVEYYNDFTEEQWNLGDRTTDCSVLGSTPTGPNNVRFTGSLRGIGGAKPTGWHT